MKGLEVQFISFCRISIPFSCWVLVSLLLFSRFLNIFQSELNCGNFHDFFTEFYRQFIENFVKFFWWINQRWIIEIPCEVIYLMKKVCLRKISSENSPENYWRLFFAFEIRPETRLIISPEVTCTMYANNSKLKIMLSHIKASDSTHDALVSCHRLRLCSEGNKIPVKK